MYLLSLSVHHRLPSSNQNLWNLTAKFKHWCHHCVTLTLALYLLLRNSIYRLELLLGHVGWNVLCVWHNLGINGPKIL